MKNIYYILSGLALIAVFGMYYIGSTSNNLSELAEYAWVPVPLGIILFFLGRKEQSS